MKRREAGASKARQGGRAVALLFVALLVTGCQSLLNQTYDPSIRPSSNPQTVSVLQKNDPRARLGAREHPRILATYGGEYRDQKTERLVARIVGRLTAVSENPNQTYRITLLDSPSVNAFALPGGYLYVTRGLLALANDASEVAAVIAHEMGHVTSNHGIERQRREEAEQIAGRVVTEVLSGSTELEGKQALARSKLRLAAFSRQQELQADVIGVRMLGEAGYDPYAAARFLESMAAYARFVAVDADADPTLDFLSSHPSTPRRVELARRHARAVGPEGTGDRGRDYYLDGIDGLLFGDRPQEGYVRGRTFLHPTLGIRFSVPPEFKIDNTVQAVLATGPGDLAIRFDGVDLSGRQDLAKYISSGWVSGLQPGSIRRTTISGLEAATARASADRWDFDVTVIRVGDRVYRILTAAPRGDASLQQVANSVRASFARLSAAEAAAIKPLRVHVVEVRPGDTIASLSARMQGVERRDAFFRLINALEPGAILKVGDRVKIISD